VVSLVERLGLETRKYVKLSDPAKERLEQRIQTMLEEGDPCNKDWEMLADDFGISLRTVQYMVSNVRENGGQPRATCPTTGSSVRYELPEDALELIALYRQVKRAWSHLYDEQRYLGDYTSFTRAMNRQYGKNCIERAKNGAGGLDLIPRPKQPGVPFMQRYTIDLFSLRAPVSDLPIDDVPTGMFVVEAATGVIVFNWVFESDRVASDDVVTVLAEAIRGRTLLDDDLFIGGLPDMVRCDNASVFVGKTLRTALRSLGISPMSNNSYASRELGAHERIHRTARTQVLSLLPGSSDGPTDRSGALLPDPRELCSLAEVRHLLEGFADERNRTPGKDDLTPLQRWAKHCAAGRIPRRAQASQLAPLATRHPKTCKRYKQGVLLLNNYYATPELANEPKSRYWVHKWLRDARTVELFTTDGQYVGSAACEPTAAERQALKAKEAADKQQAAAARKKAFARPDTKPTDRNTDDSGIVADDFPGSRQIAATGVQSPVAADHTSAVAILNMFMNRQAAASDDEHTDVAGDQA
jgi:hypothetical protein